MLCNPDPVGGHCGRPKCFPCRSKEGTCHKQGIVYEIECSHCKAEGKKVQYIGESARNGYGSGAEHMANLNSESHSSPLVRHWKEKHPEQEWAYTMKVIKSHKTPLPRQVMEGDMIANFNGQEILNQKGEWGVNLPLKLRFPEALKSAERHCRVDLLRFLIPKVFSPCLGPKDIPPKSQDLVELLK